MKNVYFLSDAHLGSLAIEHGRMHERRIVRFLDSIKHKAEAIYLLGDLFDFWNEYKMVVPKGYTRFLGKLSELTDMGVEVHFFVGNHDLWTYGYLEEECGLIVHKKPLTTEIYGLSCCGRCFTTAFAKCFSTLCIPVGAWPSVLIGPSIAE